MDFDRKYGLACLLSLSTLPIAGCPSGDDVSSGANDSSESSSSTEPTSSTTNSTTLSTSADSSGSSSESSTDPTVTGSTDTGSDSSSGSDSGGSDSSGSDSSGSSGSDSSGDTDGLCEDVAEIFVECFPDAPDDVEMIAAECNADLADAAMESMACGMAFEDVLTCIATADCDELEDMTACADEFAAQGDACTGKSETGDEPPPPDEG